MKKNKKKIIFLACVAVLVIVGVAILLLWDREDSYSSDFKESDMTRKLEDQGIRVHIGHKAENMGDVAAVVYTAAIKEDNPESVELCGLCTDICVISNAMLIKATLPEVKIIVDESCCAGVTPESHKNALEAMKMCQIEVMEN